MSAGHQQAAQEAALSPTKALGHLRELRLQIRKAAGCLVTIEAAGSTRAERDASRVAFHRHAEAIAHTMVFLDRARLEMPSPAGDQPVISTSLDALATMLEFLAEQAGETAVSVLRHG